MTVGSEREQFFAVVCSGLREQAGESDSELVGERRGVEPPAERREEDGSVLRVEVLGSELGKEETT